MKIVKYLIIFVSTIVLALFLAISPSVVHKLIFQVIVVFIYSLLVYLVWPVGTSYSATVINRFYIVIGIGTLLVAIDVLLNSQCPTFPFWSIPINYRSYGIASVILFTCVHFGKILTSLLICLLGGCLIKYGLARRLG